VQRRDPALDGVLFVAVKTTGIYCRPVCKVRTPLARNIEFYPSAAAA
jgi:AraC family transcriptional regulator of adaptative response/methylated-DNA-[protein]-cysteine methyltransferase